MVLKREEYEARLKDNPGDPIFADLADLLRKNGEHLRAIEVCLAGLSLNPGCQRGRLVFARICYERQWFPFALQELETLRRELPNNQGIQKLLAKLAPERQSAVPEPSKPAAPAAAEVQKEATIAEADFDFDELEMIGKDD